MFFDGDATNVEGYWTWCVDEVFGAGSEQVGIHTPGPTPQIAEAALCQKPRDRRRRHHDGGRGPVKGPEHRIGQAERNRHALSQIFGKSRVVRGREAQAFAAADRTRRPTERTFGRDVNRLGLEVVN